MAFTKKTIQDVPLDGQRVLLRADYNVPLRDGKVADDYRITQSIPTIRALQARGCSIVICSHLGRPSGKPAPQFSLEAVARQLGALLGQDAIFVPECVGDRVVQAVKDLVPGQVVLLENLRFHAEEEANDRDFASQLALDSGASYFVQDGFGVVHRAHASTQAITEFLPSVAGLLLEKEVSTIANAMSNPRRPLVAVLGGAKVSDKIKVIKRFVGLADQLIIGGAMANTFLAYKGKPIGKSVYEPAQEPVLQEIYAAALNKVSGHRSVDEFISLPIDVAVTKDLSDEANHMIVGIDDVAADDYIVDIGTQTISRAVELLHGSGTVIWNGTMGLAERKAFANGSAYIADALAKQPQTMTIVGGGDTADFVLHWDAERQAARLRDAQPSDENGDSDRQVLGGSFSHVSTGGGASLDLMAGEKLPGVEALMDR